MGILYMLCGKTMKAEVSNKIREMTGLEKIHDFLWEQRLRWLGHVKRMNKERGPVKALHFNLDGTKRVDQKEMERWWCET